MCNRKIQWPTIPVWWQKKGYCSEMPNICLQLTELHTRYKFHPMNPNKTYFQQTKYFQLQINDIWFLKHLFFNFLNKFKPDRKWLYTFHWLTFLISHIHWLFLSNLSKREISRECNDIIGSAKGSQISKKYWGEVEKGKRVDVYLEVRKRRRHICFECNKCLCNEPQH